MPNVDKVLPMPYFTRKRIKRLQTTYLNNYVLLIDLDDEEIWERYNFYFEPETRISIRAKVGFISDKDDKAVIDVHGVAYDFPIRCDKNHDSQKNKWVYQNHTLYLPESLTNGFGLHAGMGIEITFLEFIKDARYLQNDLWRNDATVMLDISKFDNRILGDVEYNGITDFELKGINGELLNSSEVLVSTKFTNEFYINLVSEINKAYKIGFFTSAKILLRKLFENLLLDMLREKYGSDASKKTLFYKNGEYRSFQYMKDLLKDNNILNDFALHDQTISKDKKFIPFLETIRLHGDTNAHTMEIIHKREDIAELKDDINSYSALLVRLIRKISPKTDVC